MSKEKQIEYFDEDFLGNKVNIGDKVIFQAPDYRMFTIGTVITKANKSCQIEYLNTWNFPTEGRKLICRQGYDQIIKQREVVRCADCAVPHNKWTGCPKLNGLIPPPDFYCAFGEAETKGE